MRLIFQGKQFVFAGVLTAAIGLASTAHGWSHNEHNINNTGATAYDVVKILEGDYEITEMMDWDFADQAYYHRSVDGEIQTVLRWWSGEVPPGERGDACFTAVPLVGNAPCAKIVAAWWTDENGIPLGDYIPEVNFCVKFYRQLNKKWYPFIRLENNQFDTIVVNEENPNRWEDGDFELSGQASPVAMSLRAAVVSGALTPETLTIENLTANYNYPDGFQSLGEIEVPYGETITLDPELGLVSTSASIESLVIVADLGEGNYKLYNFEAPVLSSVPALGVSASAGISFGALLLVMTGFFVIRRRRHRSLV